MQIPTCVRCPGVKLRLRGRETIEVYGRMALENMLDTRIWVCPNCRRIELQWPEDVELPEEELSDEEKRMQQLREMSDKELRDIAKSDLRSEEVRFAARKLLEERR